LPGIAVMCMLVHLQMFLCLCMSVFVSCVREFLLGFVFVHVRVPVYACVCEFLRVVCLCMYIWAGALCSVSVYVCV
jgi:hypothetical protein